MTPKVGPILMEKIVLSLQKATEQQLLRAKQELLQIGEEVITSAKQLTPVDTGSLRASGHVQTTDTNHRFVVTMGFGGPAGSGSSTKDVGYAVYVHENLAAHHPVGQAKFLETPWRAAQKDVTPRLKRAMEET